MSPIIPGLIDDLGRECLIRMPYQDLPTASLVCKTWRDDIMGRDFLRFRRAAGISRPIIILAQAKVVDPDLSSGQDGPKESVPRPTYQLTVCDPNTPTWTRLPGIPGLPNGLPMFCGLVGSETDIMVIGGWDPLTLRASNAVYIYSFISGKWRKGADMPGVPRSFFGCATSEKYRTVMVAGGHDEDKNALKSAMLYYVEKDEWVLLPDMTKARDECKVIFHRGKFHVISGYLTDAQGCFDTTVEVFDTCVWQWCEVIEDFLEAATSTSPCVAASNEKVYACIGQNSGEVAVHVDNRWQVIAKVPAEVCNSQWMIAYEENRLLVIGSSKFGESHEGYSLDLKTNKWNKVDVPKDFSGHVQCGCVLEL